MNRAVQIAVRLCQMRLFYLPIFPQLCLRQALALYRVMNQMGYPVEIHFGVIKDEKGFQSHSWVTVEGKAVADTARTGIFKAVYSYSSANALSASSDRSGIKEIKDKFNEL
jgi:Transglutaminase-like superfamily